MCVIFVSESKFLKWKYFDFVCEFQIIEKYSSGKGKEVSIIIIFIFQMHKKWTDWVTIWLSACKIHISDCECGKLKF